MRKFNTITVSIDEEIAVITINRPKFLNALEYRCTERIVRGS